MGKAGIYLVQSYRLTFWTLTFSYAAPPSGLSSPAHGQIPTYPYRPSDPQIPHVYGSYAPTHPYHGLPAGTYVSGSSSLTGALGEHATSHPSGSGSSQAPTPHPYRSSPAAPGSSSGIAVGQSRYLFGSIISTVNFI